MNVDPAASLSCTEIEVDLGEMTYVIAALPAAAWLKPVLNGAWVDIVPGLLASDDGNVDDALIAGTLDYAELKSAARAALGVAAGMAWFEAVNLIHAAAGSWVGGELTLRGVDATRLPLGAYLAAAYRAATKHMDTAQRTRFDMDLSRPPAGTDPADWYDEEQAELNFLKAMGNQ